MLETGCIDVIAELRDKEATYCREGMMPSWLDGSRGPSSTATSKSTSHSPSCGRYHPYARKKQMYDFLTNLNIKNVKAVELKLNMCRFHDLAQVYF